MMLHMFKSKIHRAVVTGAELAYEGSLAVDPELIKAAGMLVGEKVQVVYNGASWMESEGEDRRSFQNNNGQ